jgi:hypothetical protein
MLARCYHCPWMRGAGLSLILNLATIYEAIGDKDRAIEQLRTSAQIQNAFEEIVASRAPK